MASLVSNLQKVTVRYAKITQHVFKQVYKSEHLQPPNLEKFSEARQEFFQLTKNLFSKPVQDYTLAQLSRGALLVGEVAGFFVIGEMIGRRQIVGYAY